MAETILLVDDEEDIRDVLSIVLEDMGYAVRTAENGAEAFELFKQIRPPIVLSDIKMPGMDGVTLLQKIKAEDPEAEVIMITGHGDMDLAVKSLKFEATDFITKPINDDALEIALKRANEKISMRGQLRQYTENLENLVKEQSARLVEAERLAAVGQAVEGMTSAISDMAGDMEGGLRYFNEMPCFVSVHNRSLKVVAANPLYRERFGNPVGGDSWAVFRLAPEDAQTCPAAETFKSGEGLRKEMVLKYANGAEIPSVVHTAPIRSKDGEVELVMEISTDLEEVKRLQDKLRATQHKYQQLFDEAPCYISVQDEHLRIVAANRLFKEDFGTDIHAHCYRIYKHRQAPCDNCPVKKTFKDGKSHQAEMVVTSKDGRRYNVLVHTAPITDADGRIAQVMEMSTNITQIRELQDHLSSLGLLLGSMSHGIKGLLTGLDGGMYLVNSGFKKENYDQIKEGWDTVKLMTGRIRGMVQDVLYYAKERELNWDLVDAASFAEDVAYIVAPKISEQDIKFVKEFDPALGSFEIDSGVVRSALVNILENSVDACMADTKKTGHEIRFKTGQTDDHIIFEVTDNGVGMDRETRENMFTLFFSSKGHMGTGLGMFISNKIIEQHGGVIHVESEPGQGAHFTIKMPKKLPASVKNNGAGAATDTDGDSSCEGACAVDAD